ncbi:hypothetical protein K439DRAFT_1623414 [Ramaria rubella]|nr:hypothetical protein K439DRAFT_1623414 [Ramaria rubella]
MIIPHFVSIILGGRHVLGNNYKRPGSPLSSQHFSPVMAKPTKQTCSQARIEDTLESEDTSANTTSMGAANSSVHTGKPGDLKKARFEQQYSVATSTPQDMLAKQQKSWTSDVYNHYRMPPEIKVEGTSVKYIFTAVADHTLRNPSKIVTHVHTDNSTSNLVSHKEHCAPTQDAGQNSIQSFTHGLTYSTGHRPYAIVHDPELIETFKMLYEPVQIPSPRTLLRDVQEVFDISQLEVAQVLQAYNGKLHLGVDGWAAPNIFSYLGVMVTRCSAGDLITMILDFIR